MELIKADKCLEQAKTLIQNNIHSCDQTIQAKLAEYYSQINSENASSILNKVQDLLQQTRNENRMSFFYGTLKVGGSVMLIGAVIGFAGAVVRQSTKRSDAMHHWGEISFYVGSCIAASGIIIVFTAGH